MRTCTATDLAVAGAGEVRSTDGSLGDWVSRISLRDTSGSGCRLDGWPGLEFFGEAGISICVSPGVGPSCAPPPDHTTPQPVSVTRTGTPRDIVLRPGATTVFAMLWTLGWGDFCTSSKPLIEPYGVRIRVPGDSRPLTQLLGTTEDMQICGQEVQVTAFGA